MPANIIKLIVISIILTIVLFFLGQQLFPALNLTNQPESKLFATGVAVGALLASLIAGIFLLLKPYNLPIQKTTLFVGNLAFKASERELRSLFEQCGEVFSIRLMTDRVTRKPRGYGFVEMEKQGAKRALAELNEQEFMGRDLRVSLANEPGQKGNGN